MAKLSYGRLTEAVAERCATSFGMELAAQLSPELAATEVDAAFVRTQEILSGSDLGLGGLRDVRPLLERIHDGNVLEGSEILEIAWTLDAAGDLKRSLASGDRAALAELAAGMGSFDGALRLVREQLDTDGRVRDDATPKLREIRRRLNPMRQRIRERLQSIIERSGSAIQDALITQRRDRYVIPVKTSFQSQVPGIIMDSSDSGATVFIEPQAVVSLNNELSLLEMEERDEVRRILAALGQRLATDPAVEPTLATIGVLDLAQASAHLARDWNLVRPEFSDGEVSLTGLRHPFVQGCVPNDVELDRNLRLLIVTGPNAGGKTVLLKSLGLAALMAASGLFVPTAAGKPARLPRFSQVLVDMGDEQSIEASLSTYAAHLVHLRTIAREAAPDVLVLIDELGSGTDPAEGAALSQAILEEVLAKGSLGLVTTHLAPLKVFASEHEFVLNAAMRFDVERLLPTFELVKGQPGRSYALAIAERLGLGENLLARASEILGPEGERLEGLLETLEKQREQLGERLAEVAAEQEKARTEAGVLRGQIERLRHSEEELMAEAARKADRLLQKTMQQAKELKRTAVAKPDERASALQEIHRLREQARAQGSLGAEKKQRVVRQQVKARLEPGAKVEVASYGASGQVVELRGDKAVVQLGLLKVTVDVAELKLLAQEPPKRKPKEGLNVGSTSSVPVELNIRGQRVEPALEELEDFLRESHALKRGTVRILHGKGTGTLRDVVRRYLKEDKRVESFSDAPPYEGGHGVTMAVMKR